MLVSIMYHYIHSENDNKIFKNLKGISINEFEKQIKYLLNNFTPVTHNDLKNYFIHKIELPTKSFYLTFDDGFKQHITNVLPILKKYNLEGSFYIPTMPLSDNKIHFLEKQRVVQYGIFDNYIEFLEHLYLNSKGVLSQKKLSLIEPTKQNIKNSKEFLSQYKFYSLEERFYRKIRDVFLEENEIKKIIDNIFINFFKEKEFIKTYYLNLEDLNKLNKNNMIIGGHSFSHPYLDKIDKKLMKFEIDKSLEFLRKNIDKNINSFSYPFGTYNDNVIEYLKKLKIDYCFTTKDLVCDISFENRYKLTRIDANSFNRFFNV